MDRKPAWKSSFQWGQGEGGGDHDYFMQIENVTMFLLNESGERVLDVPGYAFC